MFKVWLSVTAIMLVFVQGAWAKASDSEPSASIAVEDRASQVVVLLLQSEIEFDKVGGVFVVSPDPFAMLFGSLLDLSVNSTATKKRFEVLEPIRNALIDFDFEDRVVTSIRSNLPAAWTQPGATIDVARNQEEMRAILARLVPGTALVIGVRYAFEENFELAYVHAKASLRRYDHLPPTSVKVHKPRRKKRKVHEPRPETLLEVAVQSDHALYSPFDKKGPRGLLAYRSHAAAWSHDDASAVRAALEVGIAEVGEMLRLRSEGLLAPNQDKKKQSAWFARTQGPSMVRKGLWIDPNGERPSLEFESTTYRIDSKQVKP